MDAAWGDEWDGEVIAGGFVDEKKFTEDVGSTNQWADFDFVESPAMTEGITVHMQWPAPLAIQSSLLPQMLTETKCDFVAQAPTGKGKTGAFAIAAIQRVLRSASRDSGEPVVLIVEPTRELVNQTLATLKSLTTVLGAKVTVEAIVPRCGVSGVVSAHIVVATPGKALAALKKYRVTPEAQRAHLGADGKGAVGIPYRSLEMFVVDEADALLQMDGRNAASVVQMHKDFAPHAQVLLFSATFSEEALHLTANIVSESAVRVLFQATDEQRPVDNVRHLIFEVADDANKVAYLDRLNSYLTFDSALYFVKTRKDAKTMESYFLEKGITNIAMFSGNLDGEERDAAILKFRSGATKVLICTGVLSRGFDVPMVNLVVNYVLPRVHETGRLDRTTFIHQVGRTGRVDRKGLAVGFSHPRERKEIEEFLATFKGLQYKVITSPEELELESQKILDQE